MATWKSENSILTQRGVEILNKVKAGIGNIIVTKIVAGSGRVSDSSLFFQTNVSGKIKLMTVSQAVSVDSGSEISAYIENVGFTEPFEINQICVFVLHPDYEGEQLYHISQCEPSGVDVIPTPDETIITYSYSLLLEHSNSDSFEVTVSPEGLVLAQDFRQYQVAVENRIGSLSYSDVGALPLSIVTGHLNEVQSETDLDSRLDTIIGQMPSGSVKFVQVTFLKAHPSIGGGNHIFRIDKISNSYCTVQARSYMTDTASGGYVEYTRSKSNNIWTQWARTYNTFHKPTPADIGSAPSGIISGEITNIYTHAQLDEQLSIIFNGMLNGSIKYLRVTFQVAHPVLGGGDRFIELFRANANYGTARAVGYATDEQGAFLEHRRSYYNKVWTNWSKVGGTMVAPATIVE